MADWRQPGVYIDEVPSRVRPIAGAATSATAFVGPAMRGPVNEPTPVGSSAEFTRLFGEPSRACTMGHAVSLFFQNGGREAFVVRTLDGQTATLAGVYALEPVDSFGLLCLLPPAPSVEIMVETWKQAAAYCRQRRAMLILDPPADWTDGAQGSIDDVGEAVEDVRRRIGDELACNVVAYFPRIETADPFHEGQVAELAPSGAVAGVIARQDVVRGMWKAPAGIEARLSGVTGLSYGLTEVECGVLGALGVNCLRADPGGHPLIWGARTLVGADHLASEWKYLSVRRYALFLEESLYRGLTWVAFEPNGEPLWASIREEVRSFMHAQFRSGAFCGENPSDAYFVKCDSETTTPGDIGNGLVNIRVGVAPLKPAEFVVVMIQQRTAKPST